MIPLLSFTFPIPPSVNRVWRKFRGVVVLAKTAAKYRQAVQARVIDTCGADPPRWDGPGEVRAVVVLPRTKKGHPTKTRPDLDNLWKALLDAMQHAGVYRDDKQVCRLTIELEDAAPEWTADVRLEGKP